MRNRTLIHKRIYVCAAMIALWVVVIIMLMPTCKDPDDYEPPEDSLIPAPDPPVPIAPENGYVYMFQLPPFHITTIFEMTAITDAESYEVEYTIDTFPPIILASETSMCTLFTWDTTYRRCNHYWRVRACSSLWEWFTEWSEERWFEMRQQPHGPQLLSPPDWTVFNTDTLPFVVEVQWQSIDDEEYYEIRAYQDTILLEQSYVDDTTYFLYLTECGQYSWQVRAGSRMWQYPSLWSDAWHFYINP